MSEHRSVVRDPSKNQIPLRLVVREQVIVPEGTEGARFTQSGQWIVNGDVLLDVGGCWDKEEQEFTDDENGFVEISVHPGQVEAVMWFGEWLEDWAAGVRNDDEDFSAIFSGGQRAGKTWCAIAMCVAFCLAIPDSIVWIVCPTEKSWPEIERVLEGPDALLAHVWYERSGDCYAFVNGSQLFLKGAHDPESLKVGGVHLVLLNECQMIKKKAESILRMRVSDYGGMLIGCANPPDRPIGEWVGDWVSDTDNGERQGVHFWFNPYDNPHADHRRFDALREEMDEREFESEVLGRFYSVGDVVLYNWDRLVNESTMLKIAKLFGVEELRDITELVLERLEGRKFKRALGVDIQRRPMASVEYKFFENPLAPVSETGSDWVNYCIKVITAEVVLDGEEEDLVAGWKENLWLPEETLIICDASAKWQFAERDPKKVAELRRKTGGRGSWAIFRNAGYRHLRNPDKNMEKNPDVQERCRATTTQIAKKTRGKFGQYFLFALAKCRKTTRAIRGWPNTHGRPSRTSEHAHVGDCVSYPMQRLFPRVHKVRNPRKPKVIKKFSRRDEMSVY